MLVSTIAGTFVVAANNQGIASLTLYSRMEETISGNTDRGKALQPCLKPDLPRFEVRRSKLSSLASTKDRLLLEVSISKFTAKCEIQVLRMLILREREWG